MIALFLWRCAVKLPRHRENLRTLAFGVLFGAGLYAFLAPAPDGRREGPLHWQPFSQAALENALAAHKRVLVDITADWCLNCKVNEVMVLHRPDVVDALHQNDVVLLQGNWSKPSAEIEAFLQAAFRLTPCSALLYRMAKCSPRCSIKRNCLARWITLARPPLRQ